MTMSKEIALAVTFYFGQDFVFSRLTNNVLGIIWPDLQAVLVGTISHDVFD